MYIIVGLGNPGEKYENTPHNAGFLAIDTLSKSFDFPDFELKKELKASISKGTIGEEKIILAKPETFMNNSGLSVKALLQFYKILPENLIVLHDDIAFSSSKTKLVANRGANHHRGVESIIKSLDTQNFIRLRIGVEPSSDLHMPKTGHINLKDKALTDFVLKKFSRADKTSLKHTLKKVPQIIQHIIEKGIDKSMTEFNKA